MNPISQSANEKPLSIERMEMKVGELCDQAKHIFDNDPTEDQIYDPKYECKFVSEEEFESKWRGLTDFMLNTIKQEYSNAAEIEERFRASADKKKAELLEERRKSVAEMVSGYKDSLELSLICETAGINSEDDNSIDKAKDMFLRKVPQKLDSVITPISPEKEEATYKDILARFRKSFAGVTFIDFEAHSRQIVESVKDLSERKRSSIHTHVMYRIYSAFAEPFLARSSSSSSTSSSRQELPYATSEADLFGEKAALRLAGCAKAPFLDQALPEAIKGAFVTLGNMFDSMAIVGYYTSCIRGLVASIHALKGPTPRRYLKVALPRDADPSQVLGNLYGSLGVALTPDAYSLVRKSVVKVDPNSSNNNNDDGERFLVLAFDKDEDYRRCMLHTTRIGESGCAVLKRCPTLHVASKAPLQSVPVILEGFAKYGVDVLSITTHYPQPSSSSPSSSSPEAPLDGGNNNNNNNNGSEYSVTVVCATEEWANVVAAQPSLFFPGVSPGVPQDFRMSADPIEAAAYEHNLQVKRALPSPRDIFAPEALGTLTAESAVEIDCAWDGAMWLTHFRAACSRDPAAARGYLALIALTTVQYLDEDRIAVVERAPPLDLSLWAVKDAKKEVGLAGPLASGLLVVPTAGAARDALGAPREGAPEPAVAEEPGCSPLDAARKRPGACVLVNVESRDAEFGMGWKDGTFVRSHADEVEIMLGTALARFLAQTFKSELRALTENIGTEAGNVAVVRDLLVVREGIETGYRFVQGRETVNVACSEGLVTGEESFKKVARALLVAAAKNGLRKVVVGSLCYSEETKRMFVDVVKSEFGGLFDEVVFASNNFF